MEKDKDNLAVFYKYLKSRSAQLEKHSKVFDDLISENKKVKRLNEELHFKMQKDMTEAIRIANEQNKNMEDVESEIQQALINAKMDPDFNPEDFVTGMEGWFLFCHFTSVFPIPLQIIYLLYDSLR